MFQWCYLHLVLLGAIVGAFGGLIVGLLTYGEKCVLGAVDHDCYPAQGLKIGLVTVVGLVVGLLAGRLVFSRW
jgi:hypothetical protein